MATKRILAVAFVALCAAGACNNTMAPEPEPSNPPATVDRSGGPKIPDQYTIESGEVIEPGEGNGGGGDDQLPIRTRRLGGGARNDEINPDSGESSGGDNGDRPRTAAERDRPRGRDRINPIP